MQFHQARVAFLAHIHVSCVNALADYPVDGHCEIVGSHIFIVGIRKAGFERFVGEADGIFQDIVRIEQAEWYSEFAFRTAMGGDVAQFDHTTVADDDGVDVRRLGVIGCQGHAFTVVECQLGHRIHVGADQRVGFAPVEGVTLGSRNGFLQRIVVTGGGGGVFDLPAVISDVVETDRTDLDVDRCAFHHACRSQIVHIAEVLKLVRRRGDRPLQGAVRIGAGTFIILNNNCMFVW